MTWWSDTKTRQQTDSTKMNFQATVVDLLTWPWELGQLLVLLPALLLSPLGLVDGLLGAGLCVLGGWASACLDRVRLGHALLAWASGALRLARVRVLLLPDEFPCAPTKQRQGTENTQKQHPCFDSKFRPQYCTKWDETWAMDAQAQGRADLRKSQSKLKYSSRKLRSTETLLKIRFWRNFKSKPNSCGIWGGII